MNWSSFHHRSEVLAAQAHEAIDRDKPTEAKGLVSRAADAEARALATLGPEKPRTLGITAVSAVALWYKAGKLEKAAQLARRASAMKGMPAFAVDELDELSQAIWKEAQREAAGPFAPGQVAISDEVDREKQRISERLARLDAERTKLADQRNELEIAERVLTRFGGKAQPTKKRRRGGPAATAPATSGQRRGRGGQQAPAVSLSDATLRAVQAHGEGATANDVMSYLSREFGMTVRPNHLGIALQRHRRAGRLENRDQRWYLPYSIHQAESKQLA